jgi:hypothetical protein
MKPMLRKLLALLVLVTGLAAAGTPAQALSFDVESLRTMDTASYACSAQRVARNAQPSINKDRDDTPAKSCPRPPKIVVVVPTVMLHADRARE